MEAILRNVRTKFDSVRSAAKAWFTLYGLSRVATFVCIALTLLFLIDWQIPTTPFLVRLMLLAGIIGYACYLAYKELLYPLSINIVEDDLACYIERQYPHLKDRLISAIQFTRVKNLSPVHDSPELVAQLIREAAEATRDLDFKKIVTGKYVSKTIFGAFACLAFVVAMAVVCPYFQKFLERLVDPNAKYPPKVKWEVEYPKAIARGQECSILARAVKGEATRAYVKYLLYDEKKDASGQVVSRTLKSESEEEMVKKGSEFRITASKVFYTLEFRIRHGEHETDTYRVEVLEAPEPEPNGLLCYLTFPGYTGKSAKTVNDGTFQEPMGTKVDLICPFNQKLVVKRNKEGKIISPIIKARAKDDIWEIPVQIAQEDQRKIKASFNINKPHFDYWMIVTGENDLNNINPKVYTITGIPDTSPVINLKSPRVSEKVTPQCMRPLRIEVKDDFGLRSIWYTYKIIRGEFSSPEYKEVLFTSTTKSERYKEIIPPVTPDKWPPAAHPSILDFTKMKMGLPNMPEGIMEGDSVILTIFAQDHKDFEPFNITNSKEIKFTVVKMEELEKDLLDAVIAIRKELSEGAQSILGNQLARKLQCEGYLKKDQVVGKNGELPADLREEIRRVYEEQRLKIADRIDRIKNNLREIAERGRYNAIFSVETYLELDKAIKALSAASYPETSMLLEKLLDLPGLAQDDLKPGSAYEAATALNKLLKDKLAHERKKTLEKIVEHQNETVNNLKVAVEHLFRFANYQEVVAIARRLRADIGALVWCRKCCTIQDNQRNVKCQKCGEDIKK